MRVVRNIHYNKFWEVRSESDLLQPFDETQWPQPGGIDQWDSTRHCDTCVRSWFVVIYPDRCLNKHKEGQTDQLSWQGPLQTLSTSTSTSPPAPSDITTIIRGGELQELRESLPGSAQQTVTNLPSCQHYKNTQTPLAGFCSTEISSCSVSHL